MITTTTIIPNYIPVVILVVVYGFQTVMLAIVLLVVLFAVLLVVLFVVLLFVVAAGIFMRVIKLRTPQKPQFYSKWTTI